MFSAPKTQDLTPAQVKAGLDAQEILLIDVREPDEFAAEQIAGALNVPLSTFNPAALPDAAGKTIVLQCAGGKRSAMAVDKCRKANQAIETHLGGGLAAWKAAGLPTVGG
ncbi:MAG: rhodanese-like domain-containing protein [Phenylobacterium sp.]|uniref:rhodanese-like domain-containing protein n=1 Tax=Phenylobacterium sp. TaxID=1871053 RepID=UPI002723763A|nr:rhodanese-like domain-containing protein [Phenylobacterium sp.]MDO8910582.1 rhodanese-like domain-containing protein [Phenylobacterium sp.]MDP2010270.1 rhodanese-like domain-containing protein [Phenylobacterium sp.]MDP3102764.1 rhodanese-like domain-containing protein [Phenylobacterium sp.]MDP3635175.1 rhodanese-like domain-containing protein [Phenylobacterium sp.]MDP3868670.1 rhodanese-like domain-containing protein [Phenylobacterium sp.]